MCGGVKNALPDAPNWVDVADLRVQEHLADIAQWMLWLTAGQLLLGIFGTIALIITLRESRRATATALKALHIQQSAERAILTIENCIAGVSLPQTSSLPRGIELSTKGVALVIDTNDGPYAFASVRVKNQGKSIALIRRYGLELVLDAEPLMPLEPKNAQQDFHRVLEVGEEFRVSARDRDLTSEKAESYKSAGLKMWVLGIVEYDDVFGEPHSIRFAYSLERFKGRGDPKQFGGDRFWHQT